MGDPYLVCASCPPLLSLPERLTSGPAAFSVVDLARFLAHFQRRLEDFRLFCRPSGVVLCSCGSSFTFSFIRDSGRVAVLLPCCS
ncbi:hypothetical protein AMEX_G9489 [Astyanax mexicanus]|uniref:Uncharacterized protein n=1 Tax=Astyanax mexicanus TaxID=7994 RepID=A0A8T2LS20_ASTMX|nr:hypothetical protein AMEX_G9489 [Astyanax mexicanus]